MSFCKTLNCNNDAQCGQDQVLISCIDHMEENHTNYYDQSCTECSMYVLYGIKDEIPTHCSDHKSDNHVKFATRKCRKCTLNATFGYENDRVALFCATHKNDGIHVDVTHEKCEVCYKTRASYGDANEKIVRTCANCAKPGYVNLRVKRCQEPGCTTEATYGDFKLENTPTHCAPHGKSKGYTDLRNKSRLCKICNTKRGSFGLESDKIKLYCSTCAKNITKQTGQKFVNFNVKRKPENKT